MGWKYLQFVYRGIITNQNHRVYQQTIVFLNNCLTSWNIFKGGKTYVKGSVCFAIFVVLGFLNLFGKWKQRFIMKSKQRIRYHQIYWDGFSLWYIVSRF